MTAAPETEPNVLSVDELVVAVRKLTETTAHGHPLCSIDPEETYCLCVIGRIRSGLPRCGYMITVAPSEDSPGATFYCLELAHPDRPTTHTMEKL